MTDREKFEAWYLDRMKEKGFCSPDCGIEEVTRLRGEDGEYKGYTFTRGCWVGWQAARQQESAPAPVVVTDQMAYAFHHALTDSPIGDNDVQDIKRGLQAVFSQLAPAKDGE